jgi:Pregnancy-associated plasma protein-A
MIGSRSARGLLGMLFSAGLLVSVATPVVALESDGSSDCAAVVGTSASGARGYVDSRGVVREPMAATSMKEVPTRQQNRGGPGFGATVNVFVHVITSGGEGSVGMGTIAQQMNVLDKGFGGGYGGADSGFNFKLADVDYTENAVWFDAGPGSVGEAEMKQALKEGGSGDLNVYTTSGNAYLGWAYFPDIVGSKSEYLDGVVMDYRSMPGGPYGDAYSLGGTLTHETGHWLGLYHTFDGGCGNRGDLVADTPAELTPTGGCPVGKDTCKKPGLDPIHNYMDYSYDSCYSEFTPGQASRMQDQYLFFRD